jgi:hypothetical protein
MRTIFPQKSSGTYSRKPYASCMLLTKHIFDPEDGGSTLQRPEAFYRTTRRHIAEGCIPLVEFRSYIRFIFLCLRNSGLLRHEVCLNVHFLILIHFSKLVSYIYTSFLFRHDFTPLTTFPHLPKRHYVIFSRGSSDG